MNMLSNYPLLNLMTKVIMKLFVIAMSIVFFFTSSCKEDCHEKGTCPPEYYKYELGEAKNYLWANAGSYWIYKNTKTNELDTQTCTSCISYFITATGTYNETKHITVEYEKLIKSTYSSFNKWTYKDETDKYNPNALRTYETVVERIVYGEGLILSFFNPFLINKRNGTGSSSTFCRAFDSTLVIQGNTFNNVSIFEIDMDDIWYPNSHPIATRYPNAYFFWAKNIGLVKRFNKSENYSWELIDYKIMP